MVDYYRLISSSCESLLYIIRKYHLAGTNKMYHNYLHPHQKKKKKIKFFCYAFVAFFTSYKLNAPISAARSLSLFWSFMLFSIYSSIFYLILLSFSFVLWISASGRTIAKAINNLIFIKKFINRSYFMVSLQS